MEDHELVRLSSRKAVRPERVYFMGPFISGIAEQLAMPFFFFGDGYDLPAEPTG